MIKVRLTEFEDLETLTEMGKIMHAEGVFSHSNYDVDKVSAMLTNYYADGDKLSLVAVNEDGIVGSSSACIYTRFTVARRRRLGL